MPGPERTQSEALSELLRRVFGHREFRPHQQEVCRAAAAGRDVLLVMPTGAGKSLCYQLPALARGGTALVISPLIALMDDQAAQLSALGLRVARVHSGMEREASRQACRDYLGGALDFLFIAPERMRVAGFPEMLAKRKPALVAIDEAHCISQWGHDFRPDYRTLGQYLSALRPAPIIALTATATPTVQRDIAVQLQLESPAVFITGFRRTNLAVEVIELSKPQRPEFALKLLKSAAARPAIVYAGSRKAAEEFATKLHPHFPAAAYHAGLDGATRERVQRAFLGGKLDVVVATIAFGMGIDKADVRTVLHVALPGSVEAFYQEIGRAGRDGLASRSVLLHSFADRRMQEFFLEKNYPPIADLQRVALALRDEYEDIQELQRRLKIDRETLERAVEKLIGSGVATTDWEGSVRATGEGGWQSGYEEQIAIRRGQIDRMVAFAEGMGCRMTALVEHFGDTTDRHGPCGLCDVCNPPGNASHPAANAARQPDTRERGWLREILGALGGRGTSTGKLFAEVGVTKDRKQFDALLDGLARAALIAIANDTFTTAEGKEITYRKVTITHEGRSPDEATLDTVWIRDGVAAVKSKKKAGKARESTLHAASGSSSVERQRRSPYPSASKPYERVTGQQTKAAGTDSRSATKVSGIRESKRVPVPQPQPVELTPNQQALDERLRQWRKETAREAGLPSFFIFSDSVLGNIARSGPQSLEELCNVRGIGSEKLERFGVAILEICRA